eukprot:TRINITY_DN24440_c0_g1_i5.p1 TRINITY_DN24440_c0_g1~~TRINITY_DN24440_c0_g1_i5.p1  ORF type:complete len:436 (-),score=71.20 TRINITY_DN24440_c0_g1_i5:1764-3071(-)
MIKQLFFLLFKFVICLNNGMAPRPPMGFNTWNAFGCNINQDVVLQHMDLMVDLGLKDAGYEYFNLDDCWQFYYRQPTSEGKHQLIADPIRFPGGIEKLTRHAHGLGLKFGIYSDAGDRTCAGYPGSYGFEEEDARQFVAWEVDYLKYDNCNGPKYTTEGEVAERFLRMRDALNATGRFMVYSICDWGSGEPWTWGKEVGNSWRTTTDVSPVWEVVMKNLDGIAGLGMYAGTGAWNDADMLQVGNFYSKYYPFQINRSHFALWAILKSPLLIGTDLRVLSPELLAILKAKEVIQLNQDPLGIPGDLIGKQGPQEVYAVPLTGGARGVVLFNRDTVGFVEDVTGLSANITVTWKQLGYPAGTRAVVRDLYAERDLGVYEEAFVAEVLYMDVVVVKVTPENGSNVVNDGWRPWDHGFFGIKKDPPAVKFRKRGDVEEL